MITFGIVLITLIRTHYLIRPYSGSVTSCLHIGAYCSGAMCWDGFACCPAIGVPLVFLLLMYRAKSQLPNGRVNTTLLGGAKLCSADLDDEDDQYGFLCRDLKPQYWYYGK